MHIKWFVNLTVSHTWFLYLMCCVYELNHLGRYKRQKWMCVPKPNKNIILPFKKKCVHISSFSSSFFVYSAGIDHIAVQVLKPPFFNGNNESNFNPTICYCTLLLTAWFSSFFCFLSSESSPATNNKQQQQKSKIPEKNRCVDDGFCILWIYEWLEIDALDACEFWCKR